MRARIRFALTLVLAAASFGAGSAPAAAQAPANDTFAAARTISAVPFVQTLDTTQATVDAVDAEALAACGVSATTAASVWYAYTPPTDGLVTVDTTGSSYTTGIAVVTGAPGSLSAVSCATVFTRFEAAAGQTYRIGVADVSGGSGGTLRISVVAPEYRVTVDHHASLARAAGSVTVSGTLTCSIGASAGVAVTLTQRVGRRTVSGQGFDTFVCGATGDRAWSVPIVPSSGAFKPGAANVSVEGYDCPGDCVFRTVSRRIVLRPR
jgi:hypothetical protein